MSRSQEKLGITMQAALAPRDEFGQTEHHAPKRICGISNSGTHITACALFCTRPETVKPMATPTSAVAASASNFRKTVTQAPRQGLGRGFHGVAEIPAQFEKPSDPSCRPQTELADPRFVLLK